MTGIYPPIRQGYLDSMPTPANASLDPTTGNPPRFGRQIPLSLRMFVAILVLLGAGAVWIGVPAYRQYRAIQAIEQARGFVYFLPKVMPSRPSIIVKARTPVDRVALGGTAFTDTEMPHLRALPTLRQLTLNDTAVTDAGLAELTQLDELTHITLDSTQITDACVGRLKMFPALQFLSLRNTRITDAGMTDLKEVTSLTWLVCDGTQITDAGLTQVRSLSNLRMLNVRNTNVTDAGVADLQRAMPNLRITR